VFEQSEGFGDRIVEIDLTFEGRRLPGKEKSFFIISRAVNGCLDDFVQIAGGVSRQAGVPAHKLGEPRMLLSGSFSSCATPARQLPDVARRSAMNQLPVQIFLFRLGLAAFDNERQLTGNRPDEVRFLLRIFSLIPRLPLRVKNFNLPRQFTRGNDPRG